MKIISISHDPGEVSFTIQLRGLLMGIKWNKSLALIRLLMRLMAFTANLPLTAITMSSP